MTTATTRIDQLASRMIGAVRSSAHFSVTIGCERVRHLQSRRTMSQPSPKFGTLPFNAVLKETGDTPGDGHDAESGNARLDRIVIAQNA
jgi:hypothetical protein